MLLVAPLIALALLPSALARSVSSSSSSSSSSNAFGKNFVPKNMVLFGDSYTDACNVYRQNNETVAREFPYPSCPPPPAGRAVQGRSWPEHLRIEQGQTEQKGGSPGGDPSKGSRHQTYIADLAQSGATCNNYFFPRQPVNDVGEQIKLLQNKYNGTATQTVQPPVDSDTDVALIFIGTNDVSFFETNVSGTNPEVAQEPGPPRRGTINDFVACVFGRFDQLYKLGYRKMVLLELIPLELTPAYNPTANITSKGLTALPLSTTVQQIVLAINALYPYKVADFEREHKGANIQIFPTHELWERFYFDKGQYGFTNVQDAEYATIGNECNAACPRAIPRTNLWANELHFSPHAAAILGRKIGRFLKGDRGDNLLNGQN